MRHGGERPEHARASSPSLAQQTALELVLLHRLHRLYRDFRQCNANISREHAVQGGTASEKGSAGRSCELQSIASIDCAFWVVQALGFSVLRHFTTHQTCAKSNACMYWPKGCTQKAKGGGSEFVPSHIVPALFLLINSSAFGVQALLLLALPLVKGVSSISYTYQFRLWAAVSNVRRRASVQCSFPSALRVQCVSRPA